MDSRFSRLSRTGYFAQTQDALGNMSLTVNQERIVRFFNENPEVFPSDIPLYRELAILCAELRRGQKVANTADSTKRRPEIYKRMDSIIELLGLGDRDDD